MRLELGGPAARQRRSMGCRRHHAQALHIGLCLEFDLTVAADSKLTGTPRLQLTGRFYRKCWKDQLKIRFVLVKGKSALAPKGGQSSVGDNNPAQFPISTRRINCVAYFADDCVRWPRNGYWNARLSDSVTRNKSCARLGIRPRTTSRWRLLYPARLEITNCSGR